MNENCSNYTGEICNISEQSVQLDENANNQENIQTMQSVIQARKEQSKILASFNTPPYKILEIGAQNMLIFENLVEKVGSMLSMKSIVDNISNTVSKLSSFTYSHFTPKVASNPTKIDRIQEKLEFVMKQMEAVQEDNRRKSEELNNLRTVIHSGDISSPSPISSRPIPPPFPPELDQYSQLAEQSASVCHQTISSPVQSPHVRHTSPIQSPHVRPMSPSRLRQRPDSPPPPPPPPSKILFPHPSSTSSQSHTISQLPSNDGNFKDTANSITDKNTTRPRDFLDEIRDIKSRSQLRKVQKAEDGTPVRTSVELGNKPGYNDTVRNKMRETIHMVEDSEPEEDVKWRESDIF